MNNSLNKSTNTKKQLLNVITSIFLTLTYIVFGYVACIATPYTTEFIADISIERNPDSVYTRDGLIEAAKAIRTYSFEDGDTDNLYSAIEQIKTDNLKLDKAPINMYVQELNAQNADDLGEKITITSDQLSHLTDVYNLSSSLMFPIIGIASITIFLFMMTLKDFGMSAIRSELFYSGVSTICILILFAIVAVVGFNSFFSAFHELFFPQGNWTFSADSLLIQALPTAFWIKMLGLWIAISCLIAAVSIVLSLIIKRKVKQ